MRKIFRKTINVRVSEPVWLKVKLYCVEQGVPMNEKVAQWVTEGIDREKNNGA
jgi:predicted HicB family RNase H-like nuclease